MVKWIGPKRNITVRNGWVRGGGMSNPKRNITVRNGWVRGWLNGSVRSVISRYETGGCGSVEWAVPKRNIMVWNGWVRCWHFLNLSFIPLLLWRAGSVCSSRHPRVALTGSIAHRPKRAQGENRESYLMEPPSYLMESPPLI